EAESVAFIVSRTLGLDTTVFASRTLRPSTRSSTVSSGCSTDSVPVAEGVSSDPRPRRMRWQVGKHPHRRAGAYVPLPLVCLSQERSVLAIEGPSRAFLSLRDGLHDDQRAA